MYNKPEGKRMMVSKPIFKVNFHGHVLWNSGYLELTYIQLSGKQYKQQWN
jgi:hypothetical protein